ncbi:MULTISPECIES: CynX/NimT family MFS transporter [unclassified Psychrobacter]|uniref:MFS transporter n=1 Tax=unclassified Psychrobacter TaxID=196806 RepID=UPI00086F2968|nr:MULTISPECIES: MFS transporter [unclassified Psychrobacter]OEH67715.1 MAG: MFS transporter [Psychrobacter sp. B29-1]PKG61238.1 MFS transporter [Psychrobacter sp. Choline-3u-12]PKG66787.1 MFS transporter [Psychrobacter sp. Choline-02u-13]PKH53328.1 MFS transporter [Psychrobacter sp. Choline-02u-9]
MSTSSNLSASSSLPSSRFTFWLVLCAMILLATNMRAPIVALGSIAPVVKDALDISEFQIGWLGAVPMLSFAVGALISPAIGKRFGLENTLIAMIGLLTVGMVIRTAIPTWSGFLIGTLLLTLAIGFANTLAAPVIKQRTPQHIPLITGLFSLTMTTAAGIVAGVVLPLSEQVGWQWALGGWTILGVFAFVIWLFLRVRLGSSNHQAVIPAALGSSEISMWRTTFAWQIAIFMGLQSLLFYTVASFLPSIWVSKGLSAVSAGQMGSVFQFMAPVSILSLTWLVNRGRPIQALAVFAAVLNVVGILGVSYLSTDLAWLWSGMMGMGCSAIFTLSMMLFSMRTYTTNQASELSGMAQAVGYVIAFFGPLGTGWLHETTGSWSVPLFIMLILMIVNVVIAWLVSRPVMVDGKYI